MNNGKTVFSQLFEFLPLHEFRKCVHRYRGDYKVLSFSCLDQFLCMAFAQLTFRESLRDIETCLRTVRPKLYHMGIRGGVSRNTLAHANENRDWRIYADFAQVLIRIARSLYANDPFAVELEQTVYALDSTTIDLCLSLFPWARFRKRKAAVKLHTLLDLRGNIPSFIKITEGKWHDVNILDELLPEPGSYYVMDRGYLDFERLHAFSLRLAFFVTRAKKNLRYRRVDSKPVDKTTGVRSDQTIALTGINTVEHYPDKLRRIRFFDVENKKNLVFLTNDFSLPPESIALLYKQRWQVGVSSEGRITQSVHVRPRPTDPKPRSLGGAVARKQDGEALRQHSLKGGCATLQVVTFVNADVASLHASPVAETVYNVRRQQGLSKTGGIRQSSPAGYQRRHGAKGYAATGEVLDARRRNPDEEARPITVSGKWRGRHQDGGSGRSTVDPRAAKRAGREGPGPVDNPFGKERRG